MKRRNFLNRAISFPLLMAFHKAAQFSIPQTKKPQAVCRFPEITLYTSKLEEQYNFYAKTLGLPIKDKDHTQFSILLGGSLLRFKAVKDDSNPLYHYAINIPSNKLAKAKKWLADKTSLLKDTDTGDEIFHFESWDAHAIYFKDPSGNIGELIARHTLANDRAGEFGISDLLYVSEIGTPVEDLYGLAEELKAAYGLDNYAGSAMFIGDEYGLYVAPPIGRLWFPDYTEKASVYPTKIYTNDEGKDQFQYQDYPYFIKRKV